MKAAGLKESIPLLVRSVKYWFKPRPETKILRDPLHDPLISVIIATYNWSSVLRMAIQSVLWQTEQDFEILVMGDGCTDDSEAVVRSFGDSRVHWHNLAVNSGHQSAPNNAGLKWARGRYIALLGHDDIWHPEHLRIQVKKLKSGRADVVTAVVEMIGPPGSNFRMISGHPEEVRSDPRLTLPPSGLLMTRDSVLRAGGWSDYRTTSLNPDRDFIHRLKNTGSKIVSSREMTVFKFNSALRKNSYRERPCHEQTAYMRNIANNRGFMFREALRVAEAGVRRLPLNVPEFTPPPNDKAMGWEVSQYRKYRGLEPNDNDAG